jgi:hypothetical protein
VLKGGVACTSRSQKRVAVRALAFTRGVIDLRQAARPVMGAHELLGLRYQTVVACARAFEPCAPLVRGDADRAVEELVEALPSFGGHGQRGRLIAGIIPPILTTRQQKTN